MRTLDQALDRIEKLTDDAFEWLEISVRRLAKRLTRRPNAQQSRSVPSDDRGKVDATGRRD
jgi:cobalamin biosynthesis protein CobT